MEIDKQFSIKEDNGGFRLVQDMGDSEYTWWFKTKQMALVEYFRRQMVITEDKKELLKTVSKMKKTIKGVL